ncbi:MAG: AMP-binding protein [Burkholderiaceae bacterium]|nr:AMP-binding protein [Burkholderiaceae bacterium]
MDRNPFASDWLRGGAGDRQRPQGALSYVCGSTDDPLRFMTIPALLERAVRRNGGGDAAVFVAEGERLSWHDLLARSDAVAAGLLALGIGRGDRVGIWAPNCVEWLLVQFGTARIGAVLVNINPAYRSSELEYALNKVQCRVLVMARAHRSSDYVGIVRKLAPEIDRIDRTTRLRLERLERLRHVVLIGDGPQPRGTLSFDELVRQAGPAHRARLAALSQALDPDDAINIQFTSGTTGSPKGATLSHFNIVNNARYCARAMALSSRDRLCIPVPLYHCFGMVLGVLACTAVGATMIFPGPAFDAGETLQAVQAQRCTALHGVPTMFVSMLDHPLFGDFELGSLRTGIMAGAPCPVETMRRVIEEMHMGEVTIAYGMTETSPISFQSGVDDPVERRVATVGRIQPHAEVKIVDGAGRVVPLGTAGELCTRGYLVMRGYWDDPERTSEAIDESGWMHTGDLATIDADGYCNIVGRVKDMLIRGGENVYPREIEEFLQTHAKVQSAQVFGIPHPRLGEEVCAWIVLRPGQEGNVDELQAFCRGQIAHYKVPSIVRFVPEFPMTVTGKPQKFLMRERMLQELGRQPTRTA